MLRRRSACRRARQLNKAPAASQRLAGTKSNSVDMRDPDYGQPALTVLPHAALHAALPQAPLHERRQPEPGSSARAGTGSPCQPRSPADTGQANQQYIQHLLQFDKWHCTQVLDIPPGAKQEAVLGQALSSLRGLQDAAQPGAPAVQLLPPEPQVLALALLSSYSLTLEGFAEPCPRELPDATWRARQL